MMSLAQPSCLISTAIHGLRKSCAPAPSIAQIVRTVMEKTRAPQFSTTAMFTLYYGGIRSLDTHVLMKAMVAFAAGTSSA